MLTAQFFAAARREIRQRLAEFVLRGQRVSELRVVSTFFLFGISVSTLMHGTPDVYKCWASPKPVVTPGLFYKCWASPKPVVMLD